MAPRIIALSGPISSGKTTLALMLSERYAFEHVRTKRLLEAQFPKRNTRHSLQLAGRQLDRKTGARWVANAVFEVASRSDAEALVVDSVRTPGQVEALRDAFGPRVIHVHVSASESVLTRRYRQRKSPVVEFSNYYDAQRDAVERKIESLAVISDIQIDTGRSTPEDVLVRTAAQLGLYGRSYARLVDVLVGGQWGSEGKGHIASYLAPEYDFLVRVGGPNAGHIVYEREGPFTFHQLPSGSRSCEAQLLIAPGAVLRGAALIAEINRAEVDRKRLSIDPRAMIISDDDIAFEASTLKKWIASTAQGVGAATARRVMRGALAPGLAVPSQLAKVDLAGDLPELKPWVRDTGEILDDAFRQRRMVFVEGTQGTGLSLLHGDYPHVTSRDTTVAGCLSEAGISASRLRKIVMVVRSYPIRVQNPDTPGYTSGPMGRQLTWSEVSRRSGIPAAELRRHEKTSTTRRRRRVAEFNWSLLRRSASINGPTDIALSFADYISKANRSAQRFEQLTGDTIRFIEEVERVTAAPVSLISTRFHRPEQSIIDRRRW